MVRYKNRYFFWELTVTMRKVLLAIVLLLTTNLRLAGLCTEMLLLLVYIFSQVISKPYRVDYVTKLDKQLKKCRSLNFLVGTGNRIDTLLLVSELILVVSSMSRLGGSTWFSVCLDCIALVIFCIFVCDTLWEGLGVLYMYFGSRFNRGRDAEAGEERGGGTVELHAVPGSESGRDVEGHEDGGETMKFEVRNPARGSIFEQGSS